LTKYQYNSPNDKSRTVQTIVFAIT